MRWTCFRKFYY